MDHAYFRDKVSAYHDRELPAQEQAMLEQHIASCAECQQLLAELEKLDKLVADKMELAGGDYWEKSAQKIEAKLGFSQRTVITPVPKSGWEKGLVWKLSAVAASVAILVFIGVNKETILKEAIPEKPAEQAESSSVAPMDERELKVAADSIATGTIKDANELNAQKEKQTNQPAAAPERKKPDVSSRVGRVADDENYRNNVVDSNVQPLPVQPSIKVEKLNETPPAPKTESHEDEASSGKVDAVDQTALSQRLAAPQAAGVAPQEAVSSELVHWRTVRDSLTQILEKPKKSMLEEFGVAKLRDDKTQKKSAVASTAAPDTSAARLRVLEAWYQIGLLTTDADEYRKATDLLTISAGSTDSTVASRARTYLDELKANRPNPPQK